MGETPVLELPEQLPAGGGFRFTPSSSLLLSLSLLFASVHSYRSSSFLIVICLSSCSSASLSIIIFSMSV